MATTTSKALDLVSYEDLYERWERGNWQATAIDFSQDKVDWHERMDEHQRRAALWNYSLFFHGEDRVADDLSPYIEAAPREEQKYFLTTQQVDEARHSVFFSRFMREVVATPGATVAEQLAATRSQLTWGFRRVFDRLDEVSAKLRREPTLPRLAGAVGLYHLIVEATLAQPGQHMIERYLEERDLLPGFREGMRNVALDEQRHIGFGVKLLHELAQDEACREALIDEMRIAARLAVGVFVPPNWDRSYTECFGFTLEEIYTEGLTSIEAKLRTIGLTDEELQRALALPLDESPEQRAERSLKLLEHDLVGEGLNPRPDEESMRILMDVVALSVDHRHAPSRPATIQWDFPDAGPWLLRIDNGATRAEPGRDENADLTFRLRLKDWIGIAAGRETPGRLLLTGRMKIRGSLRLLLRTPRMLGQ